MPTRQRRLLAAAATIAVLLAVVFGVWDPFLIDDRAHIQLLTEQSARSIAADIVSDVRAQILAEERVAIAIANDDDADEAWRYEVAHLQRQNDCLIDLEWLDAQLQVRSAVHPSARVALREQPEPVQRAIDAASAPQVETVLSEPFMTRRGGVAFAIVVPVRSARQTHGFVVGVVDAAALMTTVLHDHANLGYGIAILDGDRVVYRTADTATDEWTHEVPIAIGGRAWSVRVWPEPATISAGRSALPEIAVLAAVLLGLGVIVTVWGAWVERAHADEICNELERRVRERTAELQSANDTLAHEIEERRVAEASLRELSSHLLRLQDEERRRIARELHDSTVQDLAAASMHIDKASAALKGVDSRVADKMLADAASLIQTATSELRTISYLLHPPVLDALGLAAAIEWYVEGFTKRSDIKVALAVHSDVNRLPHDIEITLFRIVQEALANVHRHTRSRTARVSLSRTSATVCLEIEDEGGGPVDDKPARPGVGIAGMRERVRQLGGVIDIARDEHGTRIRTVLPVSSSPRVSLVPAAP